MAGSSTTTRSTTIHGDRGEGPECDSPAERLSQRVAELHPEHAGDRTAGGGDRSRSPELGRGHEFGRVCRGHRPEQTVRDAARHPRDEKHLERGHSKTCRGCDADERDVGERLARYPPREDSEWRRGVRTASCAAVRMTAPAKTVTSCPTSVTGRSNVAAMFGNRPPGRKRQESTRREHWARIAGCPVEHPVVAKRAARCRFRGATILRHGRCILRPLRAAGCSRRTNAANGGDHQPTRC